ncbi:MAG: DUF1800 domain-containing protein [Planctomycetia bacterium]|nr:MAG: DUF1800 domain-containing protein [Planctomycetia bacterium]
MSHSEARSTHPQAPMDHGGLAPVSSEASLAAPCAAGEARPSLTEPPPRVKSRTRSRRELLTGVGAVLTAMWAGSREARGGPLSNARWLAERISFGPTEAEYALADSLGYEGYLEHQLAHTAIDDSALQTRLAGLTTLAMQPYELIGLPGGQVRNELTEAAILRAVYSPRQLYERMVEFWNDHFHTDIAEGINQQLRTIDDREVIRPHALGRFPDMLAASAQSPSMLYYLDNVTSVVGNPNENYPRELLELHTLGVTGGYTQQDVVELARCLTGWTIWNANANPVNVRWTFRYNSATHDNGAKTVLGATIPAGGGINDGLTVLGILMNHPSTAAFIAGKLCRRFYGEAPPQSLIDTVAAAYSSTGGDIKAMLRALFLNMDPQTAPPKYKRPFHLMMSALRQSGAAITTTSSLRTQLQLGGQLPFRWPAPDGYPDTLDAWAGLILPRWNFGASLLNGNISGSSVSINTLLAGANSADLVMARIDAALFGGAMPAAQRERIRQYLLPDPPTDTRKRDAVGLAIAAPEFQWH